MKKTLTVNLSGRVYHIDEDAYRLLDQYLTNLKSYFRKQEGSDEIISDMEARISELFSEKLADSSAQVISINDVEMVISQLGTPNDFDSEASSEGSTQGSNEKQSQEKTYYRHTIKRRLFRDPFDKMLGGVASGLAAYLDVDVVWVRCFLILFLFIPYIPITIIYIILWIILPEARSAEERLAMRGEAITVENIGKTVTGGFQKASDHFDNYVNTPENRSVLRRILDAIVSVAGFFLRLFLVIFAIVCFPILFVLAILLVVMIVLGISMLIGGSVAVYEMLPFDWSSVCVATPVATVSFVTAMIGLIGIPLIGLTYAIFRSKLKWQPMGTATKWVLLVLWIVSAVYFFVNLGVYNTMIISCF